MKDNLTFGEAIEEMKLGHKVSRKGWNGKGMFIYLQKGTEIRKEDARNDIIANLKDSSDTVVINGHIDMKAADGSIVIGWLASQTDMLANDWCVVED